MGKIKNNLATQGFSGKLGEDIVFRQVGGKTFFAKRGVLSSPPSTLQLQMRDKFAQAALFASGEMDKPHAYQDYKVLAKFQGLRSAYVAAFKDFITLPEIGGLNTSVYRGKAGDLIGITSMVPYKVTEIEIRIFSPDGTVLESGKAVAREPKWRYTARVDNPQVQGSRIIVIGRDRLGRETTLERVL
jgi:hypothetical protein